MAGGQLEAVDDTHLRDGSEEAGDVDHGDGLQGDAEEERALAADEVDEEEGANDACTELDDAEDGRDEQVGVAAGDAEQVGEVGGVDGNAAGTGPLRQHLAHEGEVDTVEVGGDEEGFLDDAEWAGAHGGLHFGLVHALDRGDLVGDVVVVGGQTAEVREVVDGLVELAALDEVAGGFVLEEREEEDDAGEHDLQACGNELGC